MKILHFLSLLFWAFLDAFFSTLHRRVNTYPRYWKWLDWLQAKVYHQYYKAEDRYGGKRTWL